MTKLEGIIQLNDSVAFDADNNRILLKTNHGKLIADIFDDSDYPAINVDFIPEGKDIPISIAMIEDASPESATSETNGEAVVVRVWGNPRQEDYTERVDIPIKDIVQTIEEY